MLAVEIRTSATRICHLVWQTSALPSGPLSVELSKNDRILVGPVGFEPTERLLLRQLRMPVPPRAWLTRLKLDRGSVTQSGSTEES